MKKFLLVLMAVLLCFTLIACDDTTDDSTPNENSSTSTNDNTTDSTQDGNTDATVPGGDNTDDSNTGDSSTTDSTGGNDEDKDDVVGSDKIGLILTNALIKQFENAASMKLEFVLELVNTEDVWVIEESALLPEGEEKNEKSSLHGIAKLTVVVAKTENGYDLRIDADVKSDEGEGFEEDFVGTVLYIVDGVVYSYNSDIDAYVVSEIPAMDTTAIEGMIGEIIAGSGLTEDDMNALVNELGAAFLVAFNVVDNKGTVSADLKPIVDGLVAYLEGIDPTVYTIEDIINDILAIATGDELTAEMLVTALGEALNMTVGEYLTVMEATIEDAYGMTINELIAEITSDETVQLIIVEMCMAQGKGETEIAEILAGLSQLTIETLVPEEMHAVTMYDLMVSLIMAEVEPENSADAPEIPTAEELVAMINAILDMTLADAEVNLEIPFSMVLAIPQMIEVNELNFKYEINFEGVFQLVSVEGEYNVDVKTTFPSIVPGKVDISTYDIKVTVKLYEISDTVIEITAPTDKTLVNDIFEKDFFAYNEDDMYLGDLSIYTYYDGTIDVYFSYEGVEYYASIEVDAIDGYTVTIENAIYTNENGDSVSAGEVVIVIDPVFGEFEATFNTCDGHTFGAWTMDEDSGYFTRTCLNCGYTEKQLAE